MREMLQLLREARVRIESRGRLPRLRIAGDGEASVEVRHGEILHRVLAGYFRQFRLRRLLILLLRRLRVTAQQNISQARVR